MVVGMLAGTRCVKPELHSGCMSYLVDLVHADRTYPLNFELIAFCRLLSGVPVC